MFEKEIDLYNDWEVSTVVTQFQRMQAAAITGIVSSWWGVNTKEDQKLRASVIPAAGIVQGVDVSMYYESNMPNESDQTKKAFLQKTVTLFKENPPSFFVRLYDPAYGVRPVLFVYAPRIGSCATLDSWNSALGEIQRDTGVRPVLVMDMKNDVPTRCSNWSRRDYLWHKYDPGNDGFEATVVGGVVQTVTIRPGFVRCKEKIHYQPRNLNTWQGLVHNANAARAQYFQLVTSWNEWLENTSVEPAVEWYSPSGLGQYLDILSYFPPY